MDSAFVHNAAGALLFPQPVAFIRLPVVGDMIAGQGNWWSVIHVAHAWAGGLDNPVAHVYMTPSGAQALPATSSGLF